MYDFHDAWEENKCQPGLIAWMYGHKLHLQCAGTDSKMGWGSDEALRVLLLNQAFVFRGVMQLVY